MWWLNCRSRGRLPRSRAAAEPCPNWSRNSQPSQGARLEHRGARRRGRYAPLFGLSDRTRRAESKLDHAGKPRRRARCGRDRVGPARWQTASLLARNQGGLDVTRGPPPQRARREVGRSQPQAIRTRDRPVIGTRLGVLGDQHAHKDVRRLRDLHRFLTSSVVRPSEARREERPTLVEKIQPTALS